MHFRIMGLSPEPFRHLYGLSDDALQNAGALRYLAGENSLYPDRIEMRDSEIGETFLLVNHVSQPADTPYRATHAVFVREGAEATYDRVNEVPEMMRIRLLSLRAFDKQGMLIDADVVEGTDLEPAIERFFANSDIAYIHAHHAKHGCFSAQILRV